MGDDVVDEAEPQRLLGIDEVAREAHLAGSPDTDKLVAALSLLLWVSVVLAGRWIAYADYLFPEE
jgi:hypothetical protein